MRGLRGAMGVQICVREIGDGDLDWYKGMMASIISSHKGL
jgi:hypothetical protein